MPKGDLEKLFPALAASNYSITSPYDRAYNCVAWALGQKDQWWEPYGLILPNSFPSYFWPEGVPQNRTVNSYVELFQRFGFELASNASLEIGYTKLALFEICGEFSHVARQLPSGAWASKLGVLEDIEHDLHALENDPGHRYAYGAVKQYLRRRTVP